MHPRPIGPAYRIETPRLLLRCLEPRDAPLLVAAIAASMEHLRPWMPWIQQEPESLEDKARRLRSRRAAFDRDEEYVYGLLDPEERALLGCAGLHRRVGDGALEIGYWIHADYAGRGLATEAAGALTRAGFELHGLARMEIHMAPENARSAAVPRKLGYAHEATLRARGHDGMGAPRDAMLWTLFAEDYPRSVAAGISARAYDALGRALALR